MFLAANPLGTDQLALDREARAIQEELERSGYRDQFELVTRWAVEPMDLLRELRRLKPTLVHFCGHGKICEPREGGAARPDECDGLFFHGPDGRPQFISTSALEQSFAAAGAAVRVVVLSGCFSASQASALAERVACVVGVGGAIRDAAARAFAIGFYGGLGDSESVGAAFQQGLAAMRLHELTHGIPPGDGPSVMPPQMVTRPDVDPNELFLLHRPTRRARCSIVIKASLAEFDAIAIARLRDQLRTLSGDVSLEIIEVQEGSVRLTVSLSPEAAARLGELHASGELGACISFEVSSFQECGVDYVEGDATVEPSRAESGQQFDDFAGAKLNRADFSQVNLERANLSESERDSHIEVTHEALISAWPRLQQWIHDDGEGARMRDQIRSSARQWHDRGRPRRLLWGDDLLADVEPWLRRSGALVLSDLETAFLEARRRDARRATRIRRVLGGITFGMVVAFAMFQYFTLQTRVAQRLAEARATQSYVEHGRTALLDGKHTEALIYLAEAARHGDDSSIVKFMIDRAVQSLRSEIARLATPSGRMWTAAFSNGGKWIVTTDDKNAQVWDSRTYHLLFTLPHDDIVFHAAFSSDGTRLITASTDGFVRIWDLPTGTLVRSLTHKRLDGTDSHYQAAVMSPDGKAVVAIDSAGTIATVWDANTGELLNELSNSGGGDPPSLAFSQDGNWLATCGGGDVRVFDTHTWVRTLAITGPDVSSFSFDPTGSRLATATLSGDASIWALPAGTRVHHLHEIGDKIEHIAFSPDGAFVVTASSEGSERVWDAKAGTLHAEIKNLRGAIRWAEFDPTSKLVVSAGDGGVMISDVATGMPVSVLEGPRGLILSAHFDPSSHRVISPSWDGTARVWDAAPSYRRWNLPPIDDDCRSDASLDADQRFIAINCDNGSHIWDTARNQQIGELPSVTPPRGEFAQAFPAVSASGDRAAIATGDAVQIYALPGSRPLHPIKHSAPVNAVAFARTGHDLVSASVDGTLQITRDNSEPFALPGFPGGIDAVGFLPDGRVVAANSSGKLRVYDPDQRTILAELDLPAHYQVRSFRMSADSLRLITIGKSGKPVPPVLWDLEHYRLVEPLEGHKGPVLSARFVSNDRQILTAGADGVIRVWDGLTGHLQQTYLGSSKALYDAALAPDGSMLVTAGGDGILRFWDVLSKRMIWTLYAHKSAISGVHFEGSDIVTRSFAGEISRWHLANPSSAQDFVGMVERYIHCLPLRFDEKTGGLVDQEAACDIPAENNP